MPFKKDDERSQNAAKKGGLTSGRWKGKDPATNRNKSIHIRITKDEYDTVTQLAQRLDTSKTDAIITAVEYYLEEYNKFKTPRL